MGSFKRTKKYNLFIINSGRTRYHRPSSIAHLFRIYYTCARFIAIYAACTCLDTIQLNYVIHVTCTLSGFYRHTHTQIYPLIQPSHTHKQMRRKKDRVHYNLVYFTGRQSAARIYFQWNARRFVITHICYIVKLYGYYVGPENRMRRILFAQPESPSQLTNECVVLAWCEFKSVLINKWL